MVEEEKVLIMNDTENVNKKAGIINNIEEETS